MTNLFADDNEKQQKKSSKKGKQPLTNQMFGKQQESSLEDYIVMINGLLMHVPFL